MMRKARHPFRWPHPGARGSINSYPSIIVGDRHRGGHRFLRRAEEGSRDGAPGGQRMLPWSGARASRGSSAKTARVVVTHPSKGRLTEAADSRLAVPVK